MSAYGAGAPNYDDVQLQIATITGRLECMRLWRERDRQAGRDEAAARKTQIIDELLDKLAEARGHAGPQA
jgi:hypothetical protein